MCWEFVIVNSRPLADIPLLPSNICYSKRNCNSFFRFLSGELTQLKNKEWKTEAGTIVFSISELAQATQPLSTCYVLGSKLSIYFMETTPAFKELRVWNRKQACEELITIER
jgi:hypothetical protein